MSDYTRYVSTVEVDARKLDEEETVVTSQGAQVASKGDYAVRDQDGGLRVLSAEEFEGAYKATSGTQKASASKSDTDSSTS